MKSARKSGLDISCSVPVQNLLYTDDALKEFDTNFKVLPPLRTERDRKAILSGVADGTIKCISSNHEPLEKERKSLEFAHADFGSTGLQTAFGTAWRALNDKAELEQVVACFAHGPREILKLPACTIQKNAEVELTLFDPTVEWSLDQNQLKSKSKNSASLGTQLLGTAVATVVRGRLYSA